MEIVRESERVVLPVPRPRVNIELMAGRWTKTNDTAQWIGALEVTVDGDALLVHVRGGGAGPTPDDWGTARTDLVYGSTVSNAEAKAGAFVARFELPEADVELQANLNLGLLVVATFIRFREPLTRPSATLSPPAGRGAGGEGLAHADRFTREFFHREEAA